eukprot:1577286-Amphidinium_carterae.1
MVADKFMLVARLIGCSCAVLLPVSRGSLMLQLLQWPMVKETLHTPGWYVDPTTAAAEHATVPVRSWVSGHIDV